VGPSPKDVFFGSSTPTAWAFVTSVSVVIPALNESPRIAHSVRSAWGLAQPGGAAVGGAVEVIVVDGGSDDGTEGVAQQEGATVIRAPRGRGTQLRAGVEASSGDTLVFLHADNHLGPGSGPALGTALRDERTLWGAFRQRIEAPGQVYRAIEFGNAWRARALGLPYGDQAMFVRRSALEHVGGVPPIALMEDVALSQRLKKLARPVLLPGPVFVSARRWQRRGALRQTGANWLLLAKFLAGVPAETLAEAYARGRDA
jgi:rSAM/selenodomain-associated transferase 2